MDTTERVAAPATLRVCAALTLELLSSFIVNTMLFPNVALVMPVAREISTYSGAAFSIAVAVAAYVRPSLMREGVWSVACLASTVGAAILLYLGVLTNNTTLLLLGAPFGGLGSAWLAVLIGVGLANLGAARAMLAVPAGFVLEYAFRCGLMALGLPSSMGLATIAFVAALVASYLFVRHDARAILESVHDSTAPNVLNITSPSSYVSFSSLAFVSILLFNIACGFALGGASSASSVAGALISFIPVTIALVVVVARGSISTDALYRGSMLLVFAGLLTTPLLLFGGLLTTPLLLFGGADPFNMQAHGTLLSAGSDLFNVLMYCFIAAVGARNKLGAVSVSASFLATQWLGIGIGAPVAQFVNEISTSNATVAAWITMAITFAFVAYNYVGMRNYSFAETIEGITPAHTESLMKNASGEEAAAQLAEEAEPAEGLQQKSDDTAFETACATVAEKHRLTARETEVFELLARGRTSPVIQEKLVLSHNTVKTHVRHIYAKLDVHSQQELISMVEEATES
ncbi:response regulator transcription factor [Slackia isoflavoniconvertens]|uniref:Helix-turn-helix transcriptional regulator n=1 Tax=Slackia isoflavoniconvertens TaxID=572010 RepID=A0A3N0IDP7_9ACTN|nr:helix-turn-helix transcriptional regulator [Slackia isoflavoniconvertens]MBB3278143.1 DNA-binding CsgD family transcriptional regulator [Slackia isoflavoniconvertens]RNM35133.1 helix-turn-helix transcriptional regulator [Slackia isoflavoniconvertens]